MLSSEDCQKYIDWGMKPTFKHCESFYAKGIPACFPNLEEQIAFAIKTAKEKYGEATIDNDWEIWLKWIECEKLFTAVLPGSNWAKDADPQKAVFKLQEYMEEK